MKKNKSTRVKVAKGYGPRHAENAKEGEMPNTDTVPAMLTPREAVLNRNAAELAGRDKIEKLNAEGNALAEKGVDLASGGGKNMKEKAKKYQGGDEAVLGKRRPGDVNPPGKPVGYQNVNKWGNPYGWNPGVRDEGVLGRPGPPGYLGPPVQVPGVPSFPGGDKTNWIGGGGGATNRLAPGVMPPGSGGDYQTLPGLVGGGGVLGGPSESVGSLGGPGKPGQNVNQWGVPYGWNPNQGGGVLGQPGGGQLGEPMPAKPFPMPGVTGPPIPMPLPSPGGLPPGRKTNWIGSNNLYPPGQGMQYGEHDIGGGGGTIYGNAAPVQLSAPGGLAELVAAIKAEAKKQGLSAEQMKGLMSAFSAFGGSGGASGDIAGGGSLAMGGFQGGISDIGYPPFIGPNMQYHADKGSSWTGPYDPNYMIPVY